MGASWLHLHHEVPPQRGNIFWQQGTTVYHRNGAGYVWTYDRDTFEQMWPNMAGVELPDSEF